MKSSIVLLALFLGVSLAACDNAAANKTSEKIVVPVPMPGSTGATGEKGTTGQSLDEGIQGKPGKTGDDSIHREPSKSRDNETIIVPPPVVNMPPDIVPEPSLVKPAN